MEASCLGHSKKPEETHHYQVQLQDFKSKLRTIRQSVLSMSTADADLSETISGLDKEMDVSLKIEEFLYPYDYKTLPAPTESTLME